MNQPKHPKGDPAIERMRAELGILYRISHAMAHRRDLSSLLNEIFDILESEIGLQRGTLTLRERDSDVFTIEVSRGLTPAERARGQYRPGEGITGRVAETGKPVLVPDISVDPNFLDRTRSRKNAKMAFICVPVTQKRQVIGTLSIDRPVAPETDLKQDMDFLRLVADILAEAVSSARDELAERESLSAENRRLKQELGELYRPANIIGNCSSMKQVFEQMSKVSSGPATVLIRGESGTGKELVARAIHFSSPWKNNPFVAVNCAALPENLVESELFGHEKGAFTGAMQRRRGRFEMANGGTIFLDEIGDIALPVQVRLLRVLQERRFERVGGEESLQVNVRVIAATSRNLEQFMKDGRFREDLFYRLNVFPIHVPPLRERRSDIMLLADHFVEKYAKVYGKSVKRISTTAINMMMAYHWPGNVRELENTIERAVLVTTDEVIHGYHLPPSLQTSEATHTELLPREGVSLDALIDSYTRELLVDALKKHRGNATAAARELKTTQRIINYNIHRLGINARDYRGGTPA